MLSVIVIPFLVKDTQNLFSAIFNLNYVCLFTNSFFILYSIYKFHLFSTMKEHCMVRLNADMFINVLLKTSGLDCLLYFMAVFFPSILLFQVELTSLLIVSILTCVLLLFIYQLFYVAIVYFEINMFYMGIPFVLNIALHYAYLTLLSQV